MTGESWLPLARRFPRQGWRLIMPDLRGFGRSAKPPRGYHIDDYMRDAVRLLRALDIPRVDVVGHSFGGTGALYLASRIPHLVRRLVVLDTIPGAGNPAIDPRVAQQFDRIRTLVQRVSEASLSTLLMRIWRQSFVVAPSEELLAMQRQAVQQAERHAILGTLETILATDIGRWIARLKVPTLVIQGANDPVLHQGPDGLDNIPGAARVIIPRTGHYPQLEDPKSVYQVIEPFLSREQPAVRKSAAGTWGERPGPSP